jgi:hypothetical protein
MSGLPEAQAIQLGVMINAGGIVGAVLSGLAMQRISAHKFSVSVVAACAFAIALIGMSLGQNWAPEGAAIL